MPPIFSRPQNPRFKDLFSDDSRCPVNGEGRLIGALLEASGTGPDPSQVRSKCDRMSREGWPVAFGVTFEGKTRVYLCPALYDPIISTNGPHEKKIISFDGELEDNGHAYYTVLHDELYHKTNQVIVHTAEDTYTKYSDDATLVRLGPHDANDQGMEKVYTRCICYIPHFLVNIFLAYEDGMTVREFWTEVYPVIKDEGKLADCSELIKHFQVLATNKTAGGSVSAAESAKRLQEVGKDRGVIKFMRETLLKKLFPTLDANVANLQGDALVQTLARGIAQQDARYHEERQEKLEEKRKKQSLEHRLGKHTTARILRATGCSDEGELFLRCPLYKSIADSVGKDEGVRAAIQEAVDEELRNRGSELRIKITPAKANLFKEPWNRDSLDDVDKGLFTNFLLHGPSKEEWEASIIEQSRLASQQQIAPGISDVKQMLKMKVFLPTNAEVEWNIKRMEILAAVMLPVGHNYRTYLTALLKAFDDHKLTFLQYGLYSDYKDMDAAKGVFFLEFLSLQVNEYWRTQSSQGGAVTAPDPMEYFKLIKRRADWVPRLPQSYVQKLQLHTLTGASRTHEIESSASGSGAAVSVVNAPTSLGLAAPAVGSLPGLGGSEDGARNAGEDMWSRLMADALAGLNSPGRKSGQNTSVKSETYDKQGIKLFGKFKRRRDPATGKEFAIAKVKLNVNESAPIPTSKHCQGHMCLAWHVKGMCNTSCPRAGDHKPYSDQDYKPLIEWCEKHYPGTDE